jgi:polyphosphate glucokinase
MKLNKILGIDIGGSGVKGAIVHTKRGELLTERFRIPTPQPATPEAVADVIGKITRHFSWEGPVGVGYPGVIQHGIARTAANIDRSWINRDLNRLFSETTGCRVHVANDADAAGMAEVKFGAGKGYKGTLLMITVGTGLGTVVFTDGKLVPNLELGHLLLHGADAELYTSDAARVNNDLDWETWAGRFNEYLLRIEELIWPDRIIIGGGASKKGENFFPFLTTKAPVVPAKLMNEAGIVGAALVSKYYNKLENVTSQQSSPSVHRQA